MCLPGRSLDPMYLAYCGTTSNDVIHINLMEKCPTALLYNKQ